jgi:predicted DNA-binding transcriptional regulator AlpA
MEPLLTSQEVAALLRVDRSTLSRMRARGEGPPVVWVRPRMPRYLRSSVEQWLTGAA